MLVLSGYRHLGTFKYVHTNFVDSFVFVDSLTSASSVLQDSQLPLLAMLAMLLSLTISPFIRTYMP